MGQNRNYLDLAAQPEQSPNYPQQKAGAFGRTYSKDRLGFFFLSPLKRIHRRDTWVTGGDVWLQASMHQWERSRHGCPLRCQQAQGENSKFERYIVTEAQMVTPYFFRVSTKEWYWPQSDQWWGSNQRVELIWSSWVIWRSKFGVSLKRAPLANFHCSLVLVLLADLFKALFRNSAYSFCVKFLCLVYVCFYVMYVCIYCV